MCLYVCECIYVCRNAFVIVDPTVSNTFILAS